MIIQLPNGRVIECSVEAYLELDDNAIQELNGLPAGYTKDCGNPFYNSSTTAAQAAIQDMEEEFEPDLDEIDPYTKMEDKDFQAKDRKSVV